MRYGEFVAEFRPDQHGGFEAHLVEPPKDVDLRVPRADASSLKAGGLSMVRKVPILPWLPPYAEVGLGTDVIAAQVGAGPGRTSVVANKELRTRSRTALGPLVTIGLSNTQLERLREGHPQQVSGVVLFDSRDARGRDASQVVGDLVQYGLDAIAPVL